MYLVGRCDWSSIGGGTIRIPPAAGGCWSLCLAEVGGSVNWGSCVIPTPAGAPDLGGGGGGVGCAAACVMPSDGVGPVLAVG